MNLQHDLDVDAYITIRETCPVQFAVDGRVAEFSFGTGQDGLRCAFDGPALRKLVNLGHEALAYLPE
jgi:hypothetical protein